MTTQEFIFNVPLYQIVHEDAELIIENLRMGYSYNDNLRFDGFNAQKAVDSTYSVEDLLSTRHNIESIGGPYESPFERDNIWFVTLSCGRYGDKIDLVLFLRAEDHAIMKIGQYPSVADIHKGQIKKYDKVLTVSEMHEFSKAIGLAANGVGIGSFV